MKCIVIPIKNVLRIQKPHGMIRGASKGRKRGWGLLVVAVVVDEAAVGDALTLGIGQRADRALERGDGFAPLGAKLAACFCTMPHQ